MAQCQFMPRCRSDIFSLSGKLLYSYSHMIEWEIVSEVKIILVKASVYTTDYTVLRDRGQ
jgi:hypothetical protein